MNSPKRLRDQSKQQKRKNYLIIGVVVLVGLGALGAAYARFAYLSSQQLKQESKPAVKSDINAVTANASAANKTDTEKPLDDNSAAKKSINEKEKQVKEEAEELGKSHIDSTTALKDKAERYQKMLETQNKDKPPTTSSVAASNTSKNNNSKQPVQMTREEKIAAKTALLFNDSVPKFDTADVAKKTHAEWVAEKASNEYSTIVIEAIQEEKVRQNASSTAALDSRETSSARSRSPEKMDDRVLIWDMGETVLTELHWKLVSDYSLPVFFDVVQPPMIGARFTGNFEMTENQDGILLHITTLDYQGEAVQVEGYGIDIKMDTSPLFDNNYDSHFWTRFGARASAAFMIPFADYVTDQSTVVSDGVVTSTSAVKGLGNQVLGGIANVATEFLPDLQKYSNIPPTITIPEGYSVGVILAKPVYLSEKTIVNGDTRKKIADYK
ncbi:TrbI/VirB10 family protein [Vibrio sp. Hal054]|uniref:TrbI/VirB10 family protein n=1 Tax=Vibrio sp. Hal054 TaxID=3035158 RepID=UPI00301DC078